MYPSNPGCLFETIIFHLPNLRNYICISYFPRLFSIWIIHCTFGTIAYSANHINRINIRTEMDSIFNIP